jgi:hypothetical protein
MSANSVNVKVSPQELAAAGISQADLTWLKACRKSETVRATPQYRRLAEKVQNFLTSKRESALVAMAA